MAGSRGRRPISRTPSSAPSDEAHTGRRRATLTPIGTVSMTVYFHAAQPQLARSGSGYLLGQAQSHGFQGGYFDQTAQLWNEAGDLLVTSHQVVYYKE